MHVSSTSKKITHIVSSLNVGGAERFVIDLCQVQQQNGYQVNIVSLGSKRDDLVSEAGSKGIPVDVISQIHGWRLVQAYRLLCGADIIHFHSPHAVKLFNPFIGLLQRRSMIYTRHGAAPLEAEHWRSLHRKIRPYIDAITFVSQEGMHNFQSMHHWSDLPVRVIDNGIDTNALRLDTDKHQVSKLRLGSVGRMVKLKGQITLLEAVAGLPQEQRDRIIIDFFGDGDCRQGLESYVRQHLSDATVNFHGMVGDRDEIYNTFDVLCVTSETEGLSLAVIEAMAYKKAVLATNVGGNPKLVEHDANGLLFNYADTGTLTAYIGALLDDASRVAAMGEQGRRKVEQFFSLQATAAKFDELYHQGQ